MNINTYPSINKKAVFFIHRHYPSIDLEDLCQSYVLCSLVSPNNPDRTFYNCIYTTYIKFIRHEVQEEERSEDV